jgi:hypothetical protein
LIKEQKKMWKIKSPTHPPQRGGVRQSFKNFELLLNSRVLELLLNEDINDNVEDVMPGFGKKHRLFSLQEKRKGDEASDNVGKLNKDLKV